MGTALLQRHRVIALAVSSAVVVLAIFLLALNVAGLRDRLQGRKPAPTLDSRRVAVAIFDNRTGDPSLDNLGRMAAESISEGLLQIETIQVVPSSTVFHLDVTETRPRRGQDPVRALAGETASGLVVSGAYYLQGQTLKVRASIMDVVANKPLCAVDPATGPRERAMEAVESTRQRVVDAVAARYLDPNHNLLAEEERPPRFEAQRYLRAGDALLGSDLTASAADFKRALEIDPNFVWPSLGYATATNNQGKTAEAVAELDSIEKTHAQLTPIMRRRIAWSRANFAGRMEELYAISLDIMKLDPGSPWFPMDLALAANWTNRPREAVKALGIHPEAQINPSRPLGVFYLMEWTGALHLLGEHEEELRKARWGRSIYPHLLNVPAYEARALVALGRIEDVEKLVDEVLAVPSGWAYPSCCLPRATPAYVMLSAAEEMRAHGHREASLRMAARAVDWYRSRVGEEAQREDNRSGLGDALYQAERWEEADAVFATLAAEHPDNISCQGRLGTLAARRGERTKAERIAEKLRRLDTPYLYGNNTLRSAYITALLGNKEGAIALLREAVAQGSGSGEEPDSYGYGFIYSHAMDLEPLHGYPPFEELIKPKD
jgi:tetratricopeptide (TPR) repeat protein